MKIRTMLTVALLVLFSAQSWAQTFTESSDAGVSPGTATVLPGGTTSINGSIVNTTDSDVDLYRFTLGTAGTVSIEVLELSSALDMNLIVFNALGQGLAGDDDDDSSCTPVTVLGNSLDSCLTLSLTAGTYFIGIGDNNMGAFESAAIYNASGSDFIDNDSGILGSPTTETLGVIGAEGGLTDINDEGNYRVNFSFAVVGATPAGPFRPVPTLSEWALIMLAMLLAGIVFVRRRQLS